MLNRNEILRIERTLAKLQEGDLYDPVETRGFGTYHSIAVRLEALRVAMLKLKDIETIRRLGQTSPSLPSRTI